MSVWFQLLEWYVMPVIGDAVWEGGPHAVTSASLLVYPHHSNFPTRKFRVICHTCIQV